MVKEYGGRRYFICPWCGGTHHWAVMDLSVPLEIRPLHCWWSGNLCWVRVEQGHTIKQVLLDEETKFRKHLEQFRALSGPLSAQRAFKLRTGGGCPEEILQEFMTDEQWAQFQQMMTEQRAKDRAGRGPKSL